MKSGFFNKLYRDIAPRWLVFLGVFFVIVLITYGILFAIDFIPEAPEDEARAESDVALVEVGQEFDWFAEYDAKYQEADSGRQGSVLVGDDFLPNEIAFDALGKTVPVLNPTSRSIADLDKALLSGAVRHPDSADFKNTGNIFILAHSSYLPNVFNRNFQAFNGIENLKWGDTIRVRSSEAEYVYRVDRVYEAKASEVEVPVNTGSAKLTLATCNSFGDEEDRFIVEASLVSTKAL